MPSARSQRFLGVAGLVFVALFIASGSIAPQTPNSHASAAKVIAYYHQHKTAIYVQAYIIEVAILEGIFFFWFLRDRLCVVVANRPLANVGFAGAVLFAASGGISAGILWCLAETVNHVSPTVMQTLNVMQNDFSGVLASAGVALFLVGTGIALIRSATLPRWLGWVAVVLAVVALALPGLGGPAAGLWILIASIAMLVLAGRTTRAPIDTAAT